MGGGERFLPLRKSNREAAGLEGNETLQVTLALDEAPREVQVPEDLEKATRPEVRRDIADELANMVKRGKSEDFAQYLKPGDGKVYRIGIKADDFVATPEFLAGVRFAINALKDEDFDF